MAGKKKVRIAFSGAMVFTIYNDRVEVLIPNGEKRTKHTDGTKAQPHHAWLVSPFPTIGGGTKFTLREALIGVDAAFAKLSGPVDIDWGDGVFDITKLVPKNGSGRKSRPPNNPTDPNQGDLVGSRLTLRGGRLVLGGPTICSHRMNEGDAIRKRPSPQFIEWCPPDPHQALTLKMILTHGSSRLLALAPAAKPYLVWNADTRTPEEPPPDRHTDNDNDFRWHYDLFGLRKGDWKAFKGRFAVPRRVVGTDLDDALDTITGCRCRACFFDLRT